MLIDKKCFNFIIFFIIFHSSFFKIFAYDNPVDHKNLQLNLYLDLIKYNTQEKLGILPFILKNPSGIYLEVGTGGDPIADLLSQLPETISPTIIAADVDENIIKTLPERHPQLQKYIMNNGKGPHLKLQQLDGTNMTQFADNYLSGINASAVVHEIVSYAGGIQGMEKFFCESFRVLKPRGVLIYRDPEGVENKNELVQIDFKTPSIRLFVHIFLVKFLDTQYGKLARSGHKSEKYDISNITFTVYKKNESFPCQMNYDQYFQLRSYEIDFSRPYKLSLPRGLCREIERHYLTYLHQCNPLVFVKLFPSVDSSSYFVNYLAHSTPMIFDSFLHQNDVKIEENIIDISVKRLLDNAILQNIKAVEYGIPLHFSTRYKERLLFTLLKQYNIDPNLYLIPINDGDYLLDYRIFGLLYDLINEKIFDADNKPLHYPDTMHAQWLKREGEETYIYYSDDELITKVAEMTLSLNKNEKDIHILCPLSSEDTKFIPRLCYDEILKDSLEINDMLGYSILIKEGKRIINFGKLPINEALFIFEEIVAKDPERYKCLQQFVENILAKKVVV